MPQAIQYDFAVMAIVLPFTEIKFKCSYPFPKVAANQNLGSRSNDNGMSPISIVQSFNGMDVEKLKASVALSAVPGATCVFFAG